MDTNSFLSDNIISINSQFLFSNNKNSSFSNFGFFAKTSDEEKQPLPLPSDLLNKQIKNTPNISYTFTSLDDIPPSVKECLENIKKKLGAGNNEKNNKCFYEKIENNILGKKIRRKKINKENNININKIEVGVSNKKKHNKYFADNIIDKIKSFLEKNIRKSLNSSFVDETFDSKTRGFNPVERAGFTKLIKKENNQKFLKLKIFEIYSQGSHLKLKNNDYNKILIKKVFDEQKEKKVIQILELTFEECLDIFRKINKNQELNDLLKEDIIDFLNKLSQKLIEDRNKNKKCDNDYEDDYDYLLCVALMCYNYEYWFHKNISKTNKGK